MLSLIKSPLLLFAATMMIANIGCQNGSSNNPKSSPENSTQEQSKTKVFPNGIKIEIVKLIELREDQSNLQEFKDSLNIYQARISIPENLYTASTEIRRSHNADAVSPSYKAVPKTSAEYKEGYYIVIDTFRLFESDLVKRTISYKVYVDERPTAVNTLVLLPDLVITRDSQKAKTLNSLKMSSGRYEFGNLIMERNALLETRGADIEIFTNRLISDYATIQTFSAEEAAIEARDLDNGRSGGKIYIQANSATGSLRVELRGTAGGKGAVGENAQGTGAKGAAGSDAKLGRICEPRTKFYSLKLVKPMAAPHFCEHFCSKEAGQGGKGGQGPAGGKGKMGGTGGSTGMLHVLVKKSEAAFDVILFAYPGVGGSGGDGGFGGPGGPGGEGGKGQRLCADGATGAAGEKGPQGPAGDIGRTGETDISSIIIDGIQIL
ncbi:collagen-like protein [Bdellovibrio bacteriovorus]